MKTTQFMKFAGLLLVLAATSSFPPIIAISADASSVEKSWPTVDQPNLGDSINQAKALTVENICTPVKSVRFDFEIWVPNPEGNTWDLVLGYFKEYAGPNEIVIIDLGSGEVKHFKQEAGVLGWHMPGYAVASNGKLYISTMSRKTGAQKLNIYDPATNELMVDTLPIPETLRGETHPLVLGTDGMVYMIGSYINGTASAVQVNPYTNQVTDYGAIGPSHWPAGVWGYSGAADDRFIYIASGKVPWYLVSYDRQTRKSEVLAETDTVGGEVSVQQGHYGCTATVINKGNKTEYWLYQGKAIAKKNPQEPPPWPVPSTEEPGFNGFPKPDVYFENATPSSNGQCEIWVRDPKVAMTDAKDSAPDATLEALAWRAIRYTVDTFPMGISRLTELPDGRLFGTAGSYEGNFIYDPHTGECRHLGKISLSHYSTAIFDGKIYMSGYPGAPLYIYDLSRPWNQIIGGGSPGKQKLKETDPTSNPRFEGHLKNARTKKMYAAVVGANGKIYFGGRWLREGSGGGLGWWDPETKESNGLWEIFSNYQITHLTTARDGRDIVISTLPVVDTVLKKDTPKQGRIFIFDTQKEKIVREFDPIAGAKGSGPVVGVGGSRVLGFTQDPNSDTQSLLYGMDVETGSVLFRKVIPFKLNVEIGFNQREGFDFRIGPDGRVWTWIGKTLVRIHPEDARVDAIGKVEGGNIAFSGRDLYLGGSDELRCVRDVIEVAPKN